jgi:uncharacterized protein (TIGR02302 family)
MSEPERQVPDRTDPLFYRLRRRRRLARLALWFERVWVAVWPPLGVAGAFLCAALLDLPARLPAPVHLALLIVTGLAFVALLARGFLRISAPDTLAADRRLERVTGLKHRPLAVLTDRPALAGSEALWKAHVARAVAQIGRLRVGFPRPGLAARDPRALRAAVVIGLLASLVVAGPEASLRFAHAVRPNFSPPVAPPSTQLQAWITPPSYTGLAPLFLKPEGGAVAVPAASHLTISLTGGAGEPSLSLADKSSPFKSLDKESYQADQDLTAGGRLAIMRQGRELAAWDLTVIPDQAPVVSFPEPPGEAGRGARVPATRIPWQVSHEYGVVSLQAELRLRDRPAVAPLVVTIPLPGGSPKSAKGVRLQDLTPHPWAGLPVTARLVAKDAPGLAGTSADASFTLPERHFQHPVAQALMAVRKQLTLKPDDRPPAVRELDRLAQLDDVWKDDLAAFLNLRAIGGLLSTDPSQAAVDEAQTRMWQLALHLEEGAPERTARQLAEARKQLREAMDAEKRGEKIDPKELDRRMQALEQAMQKHMQALAEQMQRDSTTTQQDLENHRLDAQDMQRLAEQMREAAREGRMDDAREKMAELDRMLDQMQAARPEHGKMSESERRRSQQRQRGRQQMSALQDIIQREGGLLDHAQQRSGEPAPQPLRRPGALPRFGDQPAEKSPNEQSADQAARGGEQKVQQALRRALGELMQQYADLTDQVPPNLGDADAAMRDANQALGQGQDPAAAGDEQRAIEALQKGGRSMSQQMAQQFGSGDQQGDEDQSGDEASQDDGSGDQPGLGQGDQRGGDPYGPGYDDRRGRGWNSRRSADRRADDRRDPFGRRLNNGVNGADESNDVRVPDEMEKARTRAIQEELRKREAERTRPQPELDYIDRLLKEF